MDAAIGVRYLSKLEVSPATNIIQAPSVLGAMPSGSLLRRSRLASSTLPNGQSWKAHKAVLGKLAAFEGSRCLLWSGHSQWRVGNSGATDSDWAIIVAQCYPSASCAL